MLSHHLLLLLLPIALPGEGGPDPCYRGATNCYRPGENDLAHLPYLLDIWACEMTCRDTEGCAWFTWYEQEECLQDMCYLLTECAQPVKDEHSVSARLDECHPDFH